MTEHRPLDPFYHRHRLRWHWTGLAIAWTAVIVTILFVLRITTGH